MSLKYKCIIFDHDDTVVKSTPQIHYPSFVKTMKKMRPEINYSLEEFVSFCFDPGFFHLCKDILKLDDDEMALETKWWKEDVESRIPDFYEGIVEIQKKQKEEGGIICVVSHSLESMIKRDYSANNCPLPDKIYGWDLPNDKRKPSPYPVLDIIEKFNLDKEDVLVLDDLKPGLQMARSAGVDFASAGWFHMNKDIIDYMKKESDFYFKSPQDFYNFLFED